MKNNKKILAITLLSISAFALVSNSQEAGVFFNSNNESYQLIETNTMASTQSTNNSDTTKQPRYAYNPRTKKKALITEKIIVTLKNLSPSQIADKYNLKLENDFSHINIAIFSANNQDIFKVVTDMNGDSDIENAKIEVVENLNKAM
jgi:hypothetical protein